MQRGTHRWWPGRRTRDEAGRVPCGVAVPGCGLLRCWRASASGVALRHEIPLMHYDQSWMGFGLVGALQAALISILAGGLLFVLFYWLGRCSGWGPGAPIAWSFLLAALLTVSGDLWDMFYFNYGPLQSLVLLKAKLALVHDPDALGTRVIAEVLGVTLGVYLGWHLCHMQRMQRWFGRR